MARDDLPDGRKERGVVELSGFDLGAGREGNEGIAARDGYTRSDKKVIAEAEQGCYRKEREGGESAYVRTMDRMPPPAPARAWATLSF